MERKALIVVGLGYGDEGKGMVTDYLCRKATKPIVVRYNGGHQAGHTVVTADGMQHIFASFGSGTLRGIPTYWSSYCTFAPAYFLEEYHSLSIKPRLLLDRSCPVTTHYDVLYNRAIETARGAARNGSCGLGFGATVERHAIPSLQLRAEDILSPESFSRKLDAIRAYYREKMERETKYRFDQFDHDTEDCRLLGYILELRGLLKEGVIEMASEADVFSCGQEWQTFIFEGAQGVLLDLNYGHAPHVTKSNTTSRNALEILQRNFDKSEIDVEVFYVTRAYQTRHGAGPFYQCTRPMLLRNTESETNQYNEFQREFRISCLNVDELNHALSCDMNFSSGIKKTLVVTCLDQLPGEEVRVYRNGVESSIHYSELSNWLKCRFESIKYSFSSCSEHLS